MLTLLIFLAVLSILVFVHEFGHFITAKRAGLRVDEFGFGFPPRVLGIRRRTPSNSPSERGRNGQLSPPVSLREIPRRGTRGGDQGGVGANGGRFEIIWGNPKDFDPRAGGTLYSINWLPFGGFVRIKGEGGEGADESDSFAARSAGRRVWIVAAGVLMNALLAVVLIAVGFGIGFPQILHDGVSKYAQVTDRRVEVLGVLKDGPAAQAGVKSGERVVAGDGREFASAQDLQGFVAEYLERSAQFTVEQEGARREIAITPKILEETGKAGIGVSIANVAQVRYPLWLAVPKAVETTGVLGYTIVVTVGELIRDAIVGKPVTADLAGPVGIAVLTGQAARQGFVQLLQFMAILSINLAILNIIPFPALDGGRILFVLIEKLRGRPVARRVEGWIHAAGFALLIMLVIAVTVRDVGRYGGRIVEIVKNLVQ